MSKRDSWRITLNTYMEEGFLPEAVNNYLCLLGWSPKDNTERLSLKEVVERFLTCPKSSDPTLSS